MLKLIVKVSILILQLENILGNLDILNITVPFPLLSAMRTSLGQRVLEYHHHGSCQYQF